MVLRSVESGAVATALPPSLEVRRNASHVAKAAGEALHSNRVVSRIREPLDHGNENVFNVSTLRAELRVDKANLVC